MTDSENRDNKPKVLGLKSGTNTVRQNFSHGRSKSVVVETKKKKLLISKKGPVIEENNKNVVAKIETNENEEIFFTEGGFAEVQPDGITILVDSAQRADDLDEAKILKAKEEAEKILKEIKVQINLQ